MIPDDGSARIRPHTEAGKRGREAALSKREGGPYILPAMLEGPTKPTARLRIGTAATVLVLHLVVIAGLIRALAPGMGEALVTSATQAFDVPLPSPTPSPTPSSREAAPEPSGAAAPEGRKAVPREAAAPPTVVPLPRPSVPPVASTGAADTAGARDRGTGTGGGGAGTGTGSGAGGNGSGGGGGAKAVKIAGDINSARDYPAATRSLRLGSSVVIALTVDPQGSVSACRVVRPSPDPEAGRITCRLAQDRFRFRPARDGAGNPVVSVYGWQQRWFAP